MWCFKLQSWYCSWMFYIKIDPIMVDAKSFIEKAGVIWLHEELINPALMPNIYLCLGCVIGTRTTMRDTSHEIPSCFQWPSMAVTLCQWWASWGLKSNERRGVSNQDKPRVRNRLYRLTTMKQSSALPAVCVRNHRQLDSPHKSPIMRNAFPFHDIIMSVPPVRNILYFEEISVHNDRPF